jgi:hypothetical protein
VGHLVALSLRWCLADPLFGVDVGFYVFNLPFYKLLQTGVMRCVFELTSAGLDHKVRAIVDYENFSILQELLDSYSEMVANLTERFDLSTTRHTTSGFLRASSGTRLRRVRRRFERRAACHKKAD